MGSAGDQLAIEPKHFQTVKAAAAIRRFFLPPSFCCLAAAAALALAAGSEVKALLAFVTKHHVPGYPRNPDQSRAIDRSLQRLRRKKAVVFASASGWHPA